MKMAKIFLLLPVLLSHSTPASPNPFHAQCSLEWNFGISCFHVYTSLVTQIKLWTSVDNCLKGGGERCLYERRNVDLTLQLTEERKPNVSSPNKGAFRIFTPSDQRMLQSANEHFIVAKHRNLIHNYVDDLTFQLAAAVQGKRSCHVSAFSVSEPWYIVLDNGINYCNLHNLVEGSGLDTTPGFTELTNDFKCTQYSTANCTIY